ncbi:MAG: hypothetical protein MZW92_53940 [Comamonadaceae bacterium]|nr:hypothetical protein [Comamonadaceae bacterium]
MADVLARRYGWPLTERNVALTSGSQSAFFTLFNLLAGDARRGPRRRILLPLAPGVHRLRRRGPQRRHARVARPPTSRSCRTGSSSTACASQGSRPCRTWPRSACRARPIRAATCSTLDELARLDALARRRGVPLIVDAAYGLPFPGIQFTDDGAAVERQRDPVPEPVEARPARHAHRHRRRGRARDRGDHRVQRDRRARAGRPPAR